MSRGGGHPARWARAALGLALAFLAATAAAADPGPMLVRSERGAVLLEQGRDFVRDFRLAEAEAAFRRLERLEPEGPAALFHVAKIALWRAMVLEQEALYARFFATSDSLLALLERAPASAWRTHFRAEAELQRAVVHAKKQEYVRAALALRQAYRHFERNLKAHPDFFESYAGMGLCHVAVGAVPKKYRWLLRLMGFSGTIQQGLDEMEAAARRSRYHREEAAVYLAFTDLIVNESRRGGLVHLRRLHEARPASPLMGYVYGFGLLTERRAAEAERVLRRAAEARRAPGVFPLPYIDYYLGEALFRQNDFAAAASHFTRYLSAFPGQALVAQATLRAGLALEMAGRRAEALAFYERVRAREDFDADEAALEQARERLSAPLSEVERALLLGQNAFDAGAYREAVRLVQPVFGAPEASAVARAEAAYRSGRAYQLLEDWGEALRHYRIAVSRPGNLHARWGPWSQFYIGEVLAAQGDREGAREAYRAALAYDGRFAYHKALEQRAKNALDRL